MNSTTKADASAKFESILPGAWTMLTLLFMVSTLNYLDRFILSVLLPAIKADLSLNDTQLGIIAAAFTWSYVLMGIPLARLADTYSRKAIVCLSLTTWSVMTIICGLAQNFIQLAIGRVLVGVGEAGAAPPAHSMISDKFPQQNRTLALAIFSLGAPAGLVTTYIVGTWLVQKYDWRITLFFFGAIGIALAVICFFLLEEPKRGAADRAASTSTDGPELTFLQTFKSLLASPAFRHMAIGAGLIGVVTNAAVNWLPSYFIRSFELELSQVGLWLAVSLGISQLIGLLSSGVLTDFLTKRNAKWFGYVPMIAALASAPLFVIAFATNNIVISTTVLGLAFLFAVLQPPASFAAVQAVAPLRTRAMAVAVFFLIVNLIGGTIGPMFAGWLSDVFAAEYGPDSLKWALALIATIFGLWSAFHFYLSAGRVERELQTSSATEQATVFDPMHGSANKP